MSGIYAESSAVLRWLLGASQGSMVRGILIAATDVVTSALTPAEVRRTLNRLVATRELSIEEQASAMAMFAMALGHWKVRAIDDEILERVSAAFPREPMRTLDAIHLATAWAHARDVAPLDMLSCDDRLRENAQALGLITLP